MFSIRTAVATDSSALAHLAAKVFGATYGAVIPSEILAQHLRLYYADSALRADNKVNHDIGVKESLITVDGKTILAFYIPESPRHHKPIYLHGDIRQTFIRRGGGDQKASMPEIERLLRDSSQDRWDGQIFDFPLSEAIDSKSVRWYRSRFYQNNPGHDENISDTDFLYEWGYLIKQNRKLRPTRAAIMLFGTSTAIHQIIPRPTLDTQWIPTNIDDPQPEMRWLDRVVYEENIIKTWQGLVAKYYQYEPRPFNGIDPHTMMRDDTPPGYRVFREAAINLLIHQDYGDHSRKAVIKFYKDVVWLWNPGDAFGNYANLMEPGEKEARNPKIAAAFRRLALCEQAGTGLRMMKAQWMEQGHPEPEYMNDRGRKAFEFRLPLADSKKVGRSDQKTHRQARLKNTTDRKASEKMSEKMSEKTSEKILKAISGNKNITIEELASLAGVTQRTIERNIQRLQQEGHLRRIGPDKGGYWEIIKKKDLKK